jgi:hypothetical protein
VIRGPRYFFREIKRAPVYRAAHARTRKTARGISLYCGGGSSNVRS